MYIFALYITVVFTYLRQEPAGRNVVQARRPGLLGSFPKSGSAETIVKFNLKWSLIVYERVRGHKTKQFFKHFNHFF